MGAETSVTVTARVIGEVSSATTTLIAEPSLWETIIKFITSWI